MAGDLLGRTSFWAMLSDEARHDLEAVGIRRRFGRGEVLFRELDAGGTVLIMLSGQAKVSVAAASGKEVIVEVWDSGAILGELSAVDGGPRSATVSALKDVETLIVRQADFIAMLDRHPGAARLLLELLAGKLRGAARRQLEFGAIDALGRICAVLVELGDRYGTPTDTGCSYELPYSQQELASVAGLSREAVVKGLAALRSRNLISTDGRRITLVDQTALAARAAEG